MQGRSALTMLVWHPATSHMRAQMLTLHGETKSGHVSSREAALQLCWFWMLATAPVLECQCNAS